MLCGHRMHVQCLHDLLRRAEFDTPAKCPLCRGCIEMQSEADKLGLEGYENDDPAAFQAALSLDRSHVFSMYCLGLFANMNNDPMKAVEWFRRGLHAQVPVTATRYYMHRVAVVNCGVELASMLFEEEMLDEAEAMLDFSFSQLKKIKMRKSPPSINIWMGYASLADKRGQYDEAAEAYEHILELSPVNELYCDTLALYVATMRKAERPLQAVGIARRFAEIFKSLAVLSLLATCLWETQEEAACAEATGLFEHVCANTPPDEFEHLNGQYYLGKLKHRAGDDAAAVEHFMAVVPYGEFEFAEEANACISEIFSDFDMHAPCLAL